MTIVGGFDVHRTLDRVRLPGHRYQAWRASSWAEPRCSIDRDPPRDDHTVCQTNTQVTTLQNRRTCHSDESREVDCGLQVPRHVGTLAYDAEITRIDNQAAELGGDLGSDFCRLGATPIDADRGGRGQACQQRIAAAHHC
jgi:hypothetical protein